jgi:hypothetical protein
MIKQKKGKGKAKGDQEKKVVKVEFPNANLKRQREASARLADKYITKDGKPPPVEEEVKRLSGLSAIEYGQTRRAAAADLGVRVARLDDYVAAASGVACATSMLPPVPEPWSEPVDGDDLLDQIARTVILPDGAADAIALWVAFAHCHDCFTISPLLSITSPTPECGKTVLHDYLDGVVPKPLVGCNISTASGR